ncbi:hypothetical protein ACFV3R_34350 [Streptomyces sp. NPDC059740]
MDTSIFLSQDRRPDGPAWFPYAFIPVAVLVGIVLLVRFVVPQETVK